jgi:hypothetical protein
MVSKRKNTMKKILLTAVLLSIIFVEACKKDSSAPTPNQTALATKILGKWKFDKQTNESNGQVNTYPFTNDYKEFQPNGKLITTSYNAQTNETSILETSYTIKDEVTFTFGDVDRTVTTIDDHNLVFYNYNASGTTKISFFLSK